MRTQLLLLSCLLLVAAAGFTQQVVTITGHVTGPATELNKVYLYGEGITDDTAVIKNGVFSFRMPFKRPVIALLHNEYDVNVRKSYRSAVLVIDRPGTVLMDSIALDKGMSRSIIKEMPSAMEFVQLEKLNQEAGKAAAAIQPWVQEDVPGYEAKRKLFDSVYHEKLAVLLSEAAKQYGDRYSFAVTLDANRSKVSPTALRQLYAQLSPAMQASQPGKQVIAWLEGLQNGVVGAMVADFSLPTPEGKEIALSQLKGKYVLIDFWASWCGPCRQSFPFIRSLYSKYSKHPFEILSISIDKSKLKWEQAVQEEKLPWPQVLDTKNVSLQGFAVMAVPTTYLLNPEGKIIGKDIGFEENSTIPRLLQQLFGSTP
jgi:thiol-disulfide isomerase/thioredoxin